ncbi:Lactosylceramide alpha-23-sialyltransferase [Dissostichus eleginoides]|uniref:Lactosylceramide alpha-23-sialyltransferase n=1 Tax=Dissostichus eleginoides TaxID=100907 RepID=A0AAD9B428_DISEL|nr:Lactosylceramide alpha-23-sialyltransferase [Dissostichus eleginoides]
MSNILYYYRVDVIGSFQKPEELPEESTPEQTALSLQTALLLQSKQSIDRDPTPAESPVSGEAGVKGEPPSGAPEEPEEVTRSQKSVPSRSPRSGACTLL